MKEHVHETAVREHVLRLAWRRLYRRDPAHHSATPPSDPFRQWYRGYQEEDLRIFDAFPPVEAAPETGFIVDFLGVRTRVEYATPFRAFDGRVFGIPAPVSDSMHAETIEYLGLLRSVLSARDCFVALELGAGWGPWLVAGAKAAARRGIRDVRLHGVEGDPVHFNFMITHFKDNGLDPTAHRLDNAAVGSRAGRARWPKLPDPTADWSARPLADIGHGATITNPTDHLGRVFDDYIDVEVIPFHRILEREPVWDLVHIDVQGTEADLCIAAVDTLSERVRWLVIGTHSRKIDGDLVDLFFRRGWVLTNEKPTWFIYVPHAPTLEAMAIYDGTQVWKNARLVSEVE
jgi:FkbM family methyltransferase